MRVVAARTSRYDRHEPPMREGSAATVTAVFAQAQKGGSPLSSFVILIPLMLAFYFVAIRPSRKRMQTMQNVQSRLTPGREVVTTAGLYATVTEVDDTDQTVTLEIAPGVRARFARAAVMKVVDEVAVTDGTEGTDG
jgi:preprotein translocase subunit YajC